MKVRLALVLTLAFAGHFALVRAQAPGQEHWVATWATAQQAVASPPAANNKGFDNQTVRMIVRASIGGRRLRVTLSNAFGSAPVAVGAAHVALRAKDSEVVPGSDRALSFGGRPSCELGPGMPMMSDPVDLTVPPAGDLAVSLYFPGVTGPPTSHATGLHTTYISKEGDVTG